MNIVKRKLYSIDVIIETNRLYINCHGIWNSITDIPELGQDIQCAMEHLNDGFTCCTDMSDLEGASPDCNAQLSYTKMVLFEMGLTKDAFVVSHEEPLTIELRSAATKMEGKAFTSRLEAEKWLALC